MQYIACFVSCDGRLHSQIKIDCDSSTGILVGCGIHVDIFGLVRVILKMAIDKIGSNTADQSIYTQSADKDVVAYPARKDIIIAVADESIGTGTTGKIFYTLEKI